MFVFLYEKKTEEKVLTSWNLCAGFQRDVIHSED